MWATSTKAYQRQNQTPTQLRAKKTLLALEHLILLQALPSYQKNAIPPNLNGLSASLRSIPTPMVNSSSVANQEIKGAINVDGLIMEIP